jgi:SWI/SNF-related matrix-associated actin-dependent regulator 1 of chromatin subfamily A
MIRRNKEDVLPQLPKKHRVVVPMEMTQDYAEEYAEAQSDFLSWLSDISAMKAKNAAKAEALVKVEYLKTLAMRGKIKQSLEWIRDFLESEGPLVLFVNHRDAGKIIHEHFKDVSGLIDGSTPIAQRQQIVDDFQSGKIKLLVGNIKAAGVGITLTRASNVCIFELPWSPGDLEQAVDRVHRIGQTAAEVWTWIIVAVNTIEEKIAAILDSKKEVLNSVLDGKDSESSDTLMALLEQLDK